MKKRLWVAFLVTVLGMVSMADAASVNEKVQPLRVQIGNISV